ERANQCKNNHQRQLLKKTSRNCLHKYDRQKYNRCSNGRSKNGAAHLAGTYQSTCFETFAALFSQANNIFEHYNGIVNNKAHAQRQSPKTHLIECQSVKIEQRKGSNDRDRNGNGDNEGG